MVVVQPVIEKLNAYNYLNWSADIRCILLERICWDLVLGIEKLRVENEASGISSKDVKDFKTHTRLARALIYLNIEYQRIIEDIVDVKQVWTTWKSHFQPNNHARHMQLFTELLSCKILPDEKIDIFSSRINQIAFQLKGTEQPIDEVYKAFQLLRYLQSEFNSIVEQSILRWEKVKCTYKEIFLTLIAEE